MTLTKLTRRTFVTVAAVGGLAVTRPQLFFGAAQKSSAKPIDPDQALKDLMDGNARFVKGQPQSPRRTPAEFSQLATGQYPEAIIVSCADSRVAPELLFDAGVGDIFVVRVAGNVVQGAGVTVKGSIEYAVAELNVPLIFILGHSACGAVKAAKAHIDAKDSLPGSINGLVDLIKPAVLETRKMPGDALENAIIRNVQIGVERIGQAGPILAPRVKEGKLKVVGGVYDLATGVVKMVPKEPLGKK